MYKDCHFIITVQWPLLNDTSKTAKINVITSLAMYIIGPYTALKMSMALEVMKLIFALLDVSFNSDHYTVIIKRQLLYINKMIMVTFAVV